LRVAQVGQRQQCRLDHVDRVRAAQRFAENVLDPGRLDHRTDGAAGDHTRARRGRLEQHPRCAEFLHDLVRNGCAGHRHADQILAGALGALADRVRHLVGFAEADAHVARAIAHHDHRAERKSAAALDYFGHAVDLDDFFFQGDSARAYLLLSGHC
jgi:hypothetical protein